MADPVTLAALLRSGQAGAPVPTMGQDPQQAAVTLAALARAGLLSGEGGPAPGGLPTANDLLSNFTPAPSSMPPPTPAPARMPTAEQMLGSFMPAQGGPPSAYDQPGYRPTSGIAAGPQSAQEAADLDADARSFGVIGEVTGAAPANRAARALVSGRPLEAAGNAAVAAIPYRPLAGVGALGATYGAALGADLLPGMFGTPSATAQTTATPADPRTKRINEIDAEVAAETRKIETIVNKNRRNPDALEALTAGPQARISTLNAERKTLSEAMATEASSAASLDTDRRRQEQKQQQDEYERAVKDAETAKREWEARDVQWSRDTNAGRLNEALGGYGPAAAGAFAGMLTRGVGRAMGHGDSFTSHYIAPAITGAFFGGTANNAGTIYNANQTEVLNPRRRALEEYAERLPPTHPRRADALARLQVPEDQGGIPRLNPIRQDAINQLGFWPGQPGFLPTVGRTLSGALLEGAPGGVMGSEAARGAAWLLGKLRRPAPTGSTPGGSGGPGGGGPGGQNGPGAQGAGAVGGLPPIDQRRYDRNFQLPQNAPVAAGEVETWVSPSGRDLVTRGADGIYRFEAGTHGRRGGQNAGDPSTRNGWRRIASAEGAGQTMAEFLRG